MQVCILKQRKNLTRPSLATPDTSPPPAPAPPPSPLLPPPAPPKELLRLRSLPALVVLDLAGNPLAAGTEDYRLQALYHLRRLKVGASLCAGGLGKGRGRQQLCRTPYCVLCMYVFSYMIVYVFSYTIVPPSPPLLSSQHHPPARCWMAAPWSSRSRQPPRPSTRDDSP
jgi:hypothetical protein